MINENIQSDASVMHSFQAHVLHGSSDIVTAIVDGPRASAETRLAIYANAYRSRLQEVLEADYPALQVLAGDDLFTQLASGYIAAHPSTSPNARWFGAKLPMFLGSKEPFASHSVLAEMAEFEWAMSLAFDAPDDPVVQIEVLAALSAESWPELGFCLHSSVQRVTLRWNVPAFWQAVQDECDAPNLVQTDLATPWIVWRRGHNVYFRSLAADEAWALNAVATGTTFAALFEGLCQWHAAETIASRAVEILRQWIDDQMISGLREG
jgi:hypothetical protein